MTAETHLVITPRQEQPEQVSLIVGDYTSWPDTALGLSMVQSHLLFSKEPCSVYRCTRDGSVWHVVEEVPVSLKYYGFRSVTALRRYGGCLYKTPDGETVAVTLVDSNPEVTQDSWPDLLPVGEVVPPQLGGMVRKLEPSPLAHTGIDFLLSTPTLAAMAANLFDKAPEFKYTPPLGVSPSSGCTCSVPTKTSRRGLCTSCGKEAKSCS